MSNEKLYYRKYMKDKLTHISKEEMKAYSIEVCSKITNHDIWKKVKSVGITISIGNEIDTNPIIKKGWNENKIISIPKTNPNKKEMDYYQFKGYVELEETHYGLHEPIVDKTKLIEVEQIDLLIIPCVAFDNFGYRIGYGGGYFDRYLERFKGITCGIALDFQKIEKVPINEYDIPLDMIITEKQIYQIN